MYLLYLSFYLIRIGSIGPRSLLKEFKSKDPTIKKSEVTTIDAYLPVSPNKANSPKYSFSLYSKT